MMERRNRLLLIGAMMIAFLLGVVTTYSIMQTKTKMQGRGSIKVGDLKVYSDSGCTTPTSYIDWGMLEPGESKSMTLYIKNEGNYDFSLMYMTIGNWNPLQADIYLSCTWDREGQSLAKEVSVSATFTLAADLAITGITTFSFDITLTGSG